MPGMVQIWGYMNQAQYRVARVPIKVKFTGQKGEAAAGGERGKRVSRDKQ